MNFEQLSLTRPLLKAVAEQGYTAPTPIQQKAIPPVLEGRDHLGCAQTGTGKTAAFALPILQRLAARRPRHTKIRALILTPTRELALQIGDSFTAYGKYLTVTGTVIFGGVGQGPQVAALQKGMDVLVACPGRLNDLIGQGLVDLSALEIFVLDEADRMLDMGFIHDVKKVIARLPAKRQNLMFSATMPGEIEKLAASFLYRPAFVKVDPVSSTVDRIDQKLYFVAKGDKRALLAWLLRDQSIPNALVFSRTKHGADRIARDLNRAGIPAAAIHGNKSQNARVAALEGFKSGATRVLVATDIAARGIDINELSHVINFDLPEVPETYVHRIGRTARAGQDGCAISFCSPEEEEYLAGIEKLNRKKIPVVKNHPWAGQKPAPVQEPLRPAPATTKGKEERIVEEAKSAASATPSEGLSSSARRRRRRHRAGAGRDAAQNAAQNPAAVKESAAGKEKPAAENTVQPARVQSSRGSRPARPAGKESVKAQPAKAAPVRNRPAPKPDEEDPGLLLISRKPPAQKFANFEEYMKCHGGFSAPAEEGEE